MANAGHIPSGSRLTYGLLREKGASIGSLAQRINSTNGESAKLIARTASPNWYRRSRADVRHGSQATEVQPKAGKVRAPCPSETSP